MSTLLWTAVAALALYTAICAFLKAPYPWRLILGVVGILLLWLGSDQIPEDQVDIWRKAIVLIFVLGIILWRDPKEDKSGRRKSKPLEGPSRESATQTPGTAGDYWKAARDNKEQA